MSLYTQLNVVSPDTGLPLMNTRDIGYFGDAETDAFGHWIFDKGTASLRSIVGDELLTLQDPATVPTFETNYIRASQLGGKALKTTYLEDATEDAYTICVVQRTLSTNAASLLIPHGTLTTSTPPARGGAAFLGALSGGVRLINLTYRGTLSSVNTGLTMDADQWVFMAASFSYNAVSARARVLTGKLGVAASFASVVYPTPTYVYVPNIAPNTVSLGNVAYSTTSSGNHDTAEFVLFPRELSIADMESVYARARIRMANRGITV